MAQQPAHNPATMAQGAPKNATSAGAKVVVANKLPFPIRIRNFHMVDVSYEQKDGSTRTVKEGEPLPDTIVIHGNAEMRPTFRGSRPRLFMGYAMTEGVDKESYDNWQADNKDQPFIRNKLVFAMPNVSDAEAVAKENEKRVTNFEPFNPEGDPRMPAPPSGTTSIKTADAQN